MIEFPFYSTASSVSVAILSPRLKSYWDVTAKGGAGDWVKRPDDGSVPPGAVQTVEQFVAIGPSRFLFLFTSPLDPSILQDSGAGIAVYPSIGTPPKLGDMIDFFYYNYITIPPYAHGSWGRF